MKELLIAALVMIPVGSAMAETRANVPLYTWSGFYVGANAGYSWGRGEGDNSRTVTAIGFGMNSGNNVITPNTVGENTKLNGGLGGIQGGYNWQYNSWLYGLEADVQATGQQGDGRSQFTAFIGSTTNGIPNTATVTQTTNYRLPWFTTLRGRLGFTSERRLVYATAGLAIAEIKSSLSAVATFSDPFAPETLSQPSTARDVQAGWVLGAGIETALNDAWSFKLEYLHMDFGGGVDHAFATAPILTGSANVTTAGNVQARLTDDIVRVGINYRFGGGPIIGYR